MLNQKTSQFIHSAILTAIISFMAHSELLFITKLSLFLSLSTVFLFAHFYFVKNNLPTAFAWLELKQISAAHFLSSFLLFLLFLISYSFQSEQGLRLEVRTSNKDSAKVSILNAPAFSIHPAQLPASIKSLSFNQIALQGFVNLKEPITAFLFSCSNGDAELSIDGRQLAKLNHVDAQRSFFAYSDISSGKHEISCVVSSNVAFPKISLETATGTNQDLALMKGPFLPFPIAASFPFQNLAKLFSLLFLVAFFHSLIPFFNSVVESLSCHGRFYSQWMQKVALGLAIAAFILMLQYKINDKNAIEADEAAFGLMGQNLATGQSPPLFHYGQKYQGTIEAIPLSILQQFFPPEKSIVLLPAVLLIFFVSLTCIFFAASSGMQTAMGFLLLFSFLGCHFWWLTLKGWFGYTFSLAAGSALFCIALHSWKKKSLSIRMAGLWGIIAGIGFYELPLILPFIIVTGWMLLYTASSAVRLNDIRLNSLLHLFHQSRIPILAITFLLGSFPYFLSLYINENSNSLKFLVEGRALPSPKYVSESPFFDRFLNECFLVITGSNLPYSHETGIAGLPFSLIVSIAAIVGAMLSIFFLKPYFFRTINSPTLFSFSIFSFIFLSIAIGTYSPFGIWPWYYISVYFALPLVFIVFVKALFLISPGLSWLAFSLIFFNLALSTFYSDPYLFQPISLASDGMTTETNFEDVSAELRDRHSDSIISDQGMDYSSVDSGRDWIGETFTYISGQEMTAIPRHSRRLPALANDLMKRNRVSYLFHNRFYINNPNYTGIENYLPFTIRNAQRMFDADLLNYDRKEFNYLTLFSPKPTSIPKKATWKMSSSHPIFLSAINDHNISVREFGREAYWSSGVIPNEGTWVEIEFGRAIPFKRLVLFHGIKKYDFPRDHTIFGYDVSGVEYDLGSLTYVPEARCSVLNLAEIAEITRLKLFFEPNEKNYWLTIYEMWIF